MSVHNKDLNSLFIHVPKSAGTSLSAISWNRGSGHDTVAEYEARGILDDDLFVWAFVRNPFDRIASAYDDCPPLFDEFPTFEHFIVRIYNNRKKIHSIRSVRWRPGGMPDLGLNVSRIHFFPQNLLLRTRQGILRPNFVGRFENLQEDFDKLSDRLGAGRQVLPHRNKRKGKMRRRCSDLGKLYEKEATRLMVAEIYQADLDWFFYGFPGEDECEFCGETKDAGTGKYGCPNCHGEGIETL